MLDANGMARVALEGEGACHLRQCHASLIVQHQLRRFRKDTERIKNLTEEQRWNMSALVIVHDVVNFLFEIFHN